MIYCCIPFHVHDQAYWNVTNVKLLHSNKFEFRVSFIRQIARAYCVHHHETYNSHQSFHSGTTRCVALIRGIFNFLMFHNHTSLVQNESTRRETSNEDTLITR